MHAAQQVCRAAEVGKSRSSGCVRRWGRQWQTRSTSVPGRRSRSPGRAGQTAATQALASAAYRDSPLADILKANTEWHKSEIKKPKLSLFEPNLGEAFSRAVQVRMLGGGRASRSSSPSAPSRRPWSSTAWPPPASASSATAG